MIYFDNAATTLQKPEAVKDAVMQAMTTFGNPGRGVHEPAMAASRAVYEARCALAQLFHAENPARIAFTANATQALNIAIKGILNPGDHVITTAMEHNSVLRPLYELEEQGVELTILPADKRGRVAYEAFEAAKDFEGKVGVYNFRFVKPLDYAILDRIASRYSCILSVEDGCLKGGLYGAICEYVMEKGLNCAVQGIGVPDEFIKHARQADQLAQCGIDRKGIKEKLENIFENCLQNNK